LQRIGSANASEIVQQIGRRKPSTRFVMPRASSKTLGKLSVKLKSDI
jgi:hypothetical protein